MNASVEHLGRELSRQIHVLAALREEEKVRRQGFKLQEEQIEREIHRLAMDISTGQVGLFGEEKARKER